MSTSRADFFSSSHDNTAPVITALNGSYILERQVFEACLDNLLSA
jgi:hypothetical protein